MKILEESEMILVQRTAASFPVSHVSSSYLKKMFPQKILTYPNIFWLGQTPRIRYLTDENLGRLLGPLDTYHDLYIFEELKKTRGMRPGKSLPSEEEARTKSLINLKEREMECDVIVSDICGARWEDTRLFHTFNHPTNYLLTSLVKRIAEIASLPFSDPGQKNEYLDQIVVPSSLHAKDSLYKGVECKIKTSGIVSRGKKTFYKTTELTNRFYEIYDHYQANEADLEMARMTPQM